MSKMKDNLKKFLPLPARWQVQQNKYLISKMDSIEMQLKEIVSRTSTENVENSYKNSPPLQGLNESLQILNMDKSITDLQYFKVVLFGVGNYHKRVLKYFFAANINVAYFIDNKTDNTLQPSPYNILDPEVLLSEDKTKLKIIIMYDFPKYETIEEQLRKMGFYDCIYQTKVTCCTKLLHNITFIGGKIGFCCASSSNFNTSRPSFPYLDTSEKTIVDVLKKRKTIIRELTKGEKLTIAKPCENCSKLTSENYLFGLKEIKSINISCYPSICQARCFFCSVYKNPRNNYEASKDSNYPKMIAEMLRWLNVNDHITNRCSFTVAPAEITIMPHKDFLLETISKNKARFFTNGFVFDNKIAQSMKDRKSIIQISIDAGTRKTFQKIKGLDMYEKVVNNLLEYRKYGDIDLKYVIIPGVNDNDEDINGMINLLELIKSNKMCLSYEYGMPVRSVFYALFHFVEKLKLNNKTFTFYPSYSAKQILSFIKEHSSTEYIFYLEQKNNFYKENFYKKYQSDYDSYRKFVYNTELTDLFKLFSQKTRFCLLNCDENKEIISVINELKLNVISITAPYEQAYEKFKSNVDVFITNNKGQFRGLQSFISSEGEVAKKFLDIETYMQSLEPKEVFVKNNVYHGLISSNGQ